jgi:hypothetical protein
MICYTGLLHMLLKQNSEATRLFRALEEGEQLITNRPSK